MLRFITQSDEIREYFKERFDPDNNETADSLEQKDIELEIAIAESFQYDENNPEKQLVSDQVAYQYDSLKNRFAMEALMEMFESADLLYDYFGIDEEAFTIDYREYKAKQAVGDYKGMTRLFFKLRRPMLFYPKKD